MTSAEATILKSWNKPNIAVARQSDITLSIVLTRFCPVGCPHCSAECSTENGGDVDVSAIDAWLNNQQGKPFKYIIATGGEPFARRKLLNRLCKSAHSRGISIAAVTSAYWAKSISISKQILMPLVAAGLRSITISVDKAHQTVVPAKAVQNAIYIAKSLNLGVALAFRHNNSKPNEDEIAWLHSTIGPALKFVDGVLSAPFQPVGRATGWTDSIDDPLLRLCPAWGVTIIPPDRVAFCCGALAEPPTILEVGRLKSFGTQTIAELARLNVLNLILQYEGLSALLKTAVKIGVQGLKDHYHPFDYCGLCSDLLSNPETVGKILRIHSLEKNLRRLALMRLALLGDSWYIRNIENLRLIECA